MSPDYRGCHHQKMDFFYSHFAQFGCHFRVSKLVIFKIESISFIIDNITMTINLSIFFEKYRLMRLYMIIV